MRRWLVLVLVSVAVAVSARRGFAQEPRLREPGGLDFSPDGVWRVRARRVREARAAALARGDLSTLNAPAAARAQMAMAVSGTLRVPFLLVRFRNTDSTTLRAPLTYDSLLVRPTPPQGRPYTLRTFYEEMSNSLLSVQGQVLGWLPLDSNDTWYAGACNGLRGYCSNPRTGDLMRGALIRADSTVDFGQFDNDGPDGMSNSGDDDGVVDLAAFIQPEVDGACTNGSNGNIWSHRDRYAYWFGTSFVTNDARQGGGFIKIDDYTIQSGVGGSTACTASQPMAVGTIAHEFGHGFGLPDLYDTDPNDVDDSEGIGNWGLMGSGNVYVTPLSPSYMEGWSRSQLGWVVLRPVITAVPYELGPYVSGDTVLLVRPTASNPRGEYFLIENRQPLLGDTALLRTTGPGLLIWHVDSTKVASGSFSNGVNTGLIHGLWLMEADGLNQLRLTPPPGVVYRGDAGDPFPGSTNNTIFSAATNPSSNLNTGLPSGIQIDSITQVSPGGAIAFRLVMGSEVRASDTAAMVRVNGVAYSVYRKLVTAAAETLTISIDSAQTAAGEATRFEYRSWSDGEARAHTVIVTPSAPLTLVAQVATFNRVAVTTVGSGTVTGTPALGADGSEMILATETVRLTARPSPQNVFESWTGDAAGFEPTLVLVASRPFSLTATFAPLLLDSAVAQLLRGSGLTDEQQSLLDLQGNLNGVFDLGDFVAWLDRSGTTVSAEVMARVLGRLRR